MEENDTSKKTWKGKKGKVKEFSVFLVMHNYMRTQTIPYMENLLKPHNDGKGIPKYCMT